MNTKLALSLVLCLPLAGCAGGSVPVIEIAGASPETLAAGDDAKDDLTIVVRYSDPDGDLGQGLARVFDCRADGLVTELSIPKIANDDAVALGAAIEGEMELVVADVGEVAAAGEPSQECADLGGSGGAEGGHVFCVVVADAAGNESEGACTGPIAVEP